MTVLSIDLALTRHADIGVALLHAGPCHRLRARGLVVQLPDPPDVHRLADWIETTAAAHDVRCLCIDGPHAWQGPDTPALHGAVHSRLSEKRVRAPGKTGLPPDGVKPRPYLAFTRFSIALFAQLVERGWTLPDGTHTHADATTAPARLITESFPTAAWRALGLVPLAGKARARSDAAAVPDALARLHGVVDLDVDGITTHDQLQALVGGIAGVWWESGPAGRVEFVGASPFRLDGTWREGYIILPTRSLPLLP